jgi:hypothetical protein
VRVGRVIQQWFIAEHRFWKVGLSLGFGVLTLLWTLPLNSFVYGQDSFHFFVQPFNYNFSPTIPYNYVYSSSTPLYDTSQYFYLTTFSQFFHILGISDALAEHVEIVLGTSLAVFGLIDLIQLTERLNHSDRQRVDGWFLAAAFFVFNPFSLSVVWWHFEAWTLFFILTPYLISLCLSICFSKNLPWNRLIVTVIVSILLAPGLTGAYGISAGLIFLYTGCVVVGLVITGRLQWTDAWKRLSLVFLSGLLLLTWTNLPLLILGQQVGFGLLTGPGIPQEFLYQSRHTSLLNVVTLLGLSWIYDHPGAYGWTPQLAYLLGAAFICPALLTLSGFFLRSRREVSFLLPFVLLCILISTGNNPPAGPVNNFLVNLGGFGSYLVNPYYFVCEYYAVFLSIIMYLLWVGSTNEFRSVGVESSTDAGDSPKPPDKAPYLQKKSALFRRTKRKYLRQTALLAVCAVLVATTSVMAAPFIEGRVYVSTGSFEDQFVPPSDLTDLSNFFQQNYSGPIYYVLVLPISPSSVPLVNYSNGQFVDSSELLASYIPYPLYYATPNSIGNYLFDGIASGAVLNFTVLFASLHIKYIVLNPFYAAQPGLPTHSLNGSSYNASETSMRLSAGLGPSSRAGQFEIFTVADVTPIAYVVANPMILNSPNPGSLMGFMSSLKSTPSNLASALRLAIWSLNTSTDSNFSVGQVLPLNGGFQTFSVGPNVTPYIVNGSGSVQTWNTSATDSGIPGVSWDPTTGKVMLVPGEIQSPNSTAANLTTLVPVNGSFSNPLGRAGTLGWWLHGVPPPLWFHTDVNVTALAPRNWITVTVSLGNVSIQLSLYNDSSTQSSVIAATAFNDGNRYAWNNAALPDGFFDGIESIDTWVNSTTIRVATASHLPGRPIVWDTLNYSGEYLSHNGGRNLTAAPSVAPGFQSYSVTVLANQVGAELVDPSILKPLSFSYLLDWLRERTPMLQQQRVSFNPTGQILTSVTTNQSTQPLFVVLDFPATPFWQLSSSAGTSTKIANLTYANVYKISDLGSLGQVHFTLQFEAPYLASVELSGVELAFACTIGAWLGLTSIRRTRRLRRNDSASSETRPENQSR